MGKLTINKAKGLPPGLHHDSRTLYLLVKPSLNKSWVQRLTINGRRHDLGLGAFPLVTPERARRIAATNRLAVLDGKNPLAEKRKIQTPTFREAAAKTHETLRPRWRSEKVAKNWKQILENHAMKQLGHLPVDQIERADVLRVLAPIWTAKPETARRVRRFIRQTLEWAQDSGFIRHNVAGETFGVALAPMPAVRKNMRSLPYVDIPAAVETIRKSPASMAAKACFEFVILTACRSGEARLARWSEINLDDRLWTIPASRTKTNREHRQPLSDQAVAVLKNIQFLRDGSGLVFPSPVKIGKPLSNMSLTKLLRDNGLADRAQVHGFRASFRTWASERTNADHAVMELSLAHAVGNATEQAYARSDLLAKRRSLMEKWGAFVTGKPVAKVVAIR